MGVMQWRQQMGALLGAVVLLTMLLMVVATSRAPGTAGETLTPPSQPNFSNQAKTTSDQAASFEIDIPSTGSIETPWDTGSLWDDEAPTYDLRPGD